MISPTTIQLLAARTASILVSWAGLSSARKNDNGDRSSTGGLCMLLGMLADKSRPPPPDAEQRITEYLVRTMTAKASRGYLYMSLCVDYGPDSELSDLASSCGLDVSWPNKSRLHIDAGEGNPGSVSNAQGYGAPSINYQLVPELAGTLVTNGFSVASQVRAIVAQAVINGDTIGGTASWEPYSVLAVPAVEPATDEDEDDDFDDTMTKDEVEFNDDHCVPVYDPYCSNRR